MADNCPVCKTVLNGKKPTKNLAFSTYAYDCPRCGKFMFKFSESELARILNYGNDEDKIIVLSHNIRKRQKNNSEVVLDGDLVKEILKKPLPTPAEQKDIFIRWVGDNIKAGGDYVRVNKYSILAIIGARTDAEFSFIFEHLKKKGVVKNKTVVGGGDSALMDVTLSFEGREYYEELKRVVETKQEKEVKSENGEKKEGNVLTMSVRSSKDNWEAIKDEYDISKRDFGKKINFVSDSFKRKIIFRDVEHAFVLASQGFSKPVIILAGGVTEELLRLYLKHKKIKSGGKRFVDYIKACENNGLLKRGVSRLTDSIRDFRNLVHLDNEKTKRHTISKATAKGAVASIFTIANDFDP